MFLFHLIVTRKLASPMAKITDNDPKARIVCSTLVCKCEHAENLVDALKGSNVQKDPLGQNTVERLSRLLDRVH